MRLILATATAALAISVATSTAVFAQKKNTDDAKASRAQARESINHSFNRCVSLAKSRGFTRSDLDDGGSAARNFVMSCMQGKQR
jgi:multidrug resistance efflux pump